MENASKALLIAGAVLIVIVLITLGVVLVNRSGDASGQAQELSNTIEQSSGQGINTINSLTTNMFDFD